MAQPLLRLRAIALALRALLCEEGNMTHSSSVQTATSSTFGCGFAAQCFLCTFPDLVAFGACRTLPRCGWSNGALEICLRTGIAVDRHMLGNIELQPLDVVVQRYGVRADILDRRAGRGWSHIRINENLRLGK